VSVSGPGSAPARDRSKDGADDRGWSRSAAKDLVGDFFFGQADERTAQQRAQGKGVAPVGDGPCHRDQVLTSWRLKNPLPAWVAIGMARLSSARS